MAKLEPGRHARSSEAGESGWLYAWATCSRPVNDFCLVQQSGPIPIDKLAKQHKEFPMLIFCDESGAKGRATNDETTPGELGVFAGFALADEQTKQVSNALTTFVPVTDGKMKLHITDLQPAEQERLRDSIFEYFLNNRIPCLYDAVYVAGFHAEYLLQKRAQDEAMKARRSPIRLNVRVEVETLHHALFQGLMAKAVALYEDSSRDGKLEAVLDNVDKPIEEIFVEQIEELLSVGKLEVFEVKGFDLGTKTKMMGEVRIHAQLPKCFELSVDRTKVMIHVQQTPDPLTLAADVLANSLCHHFKELNKVNVGVPLHNSQAIEAHPLRAVLYGIQNDWMSDTIYTHPARR